MKKEKNCVLLSLVCTTISRKVRRTKTSQTMTVNGAVSEQSVSVYSPRAGCRGEGYREIFHQNTSWDCTL